MERMAWKGRIKPGKKAEYIRRHKEIWPEMVSVLKEAGIVNYSIFCCGDELFGYYECQKGVAFAEKTGIEKLRLTTRDVPDYDVLHAAFSAGLCPSAFHAAEGIWTQRFLFCNDLPLYRIQAAHLDNADPFILRRHLKGA